MPSLDPKYYIYYIRGEEGLMTEFDTKEQLNEYLADFNTTGVSFYKIISGFDLREWSDIPTDRNYTN